MEFEGRRLRMRTWLVVIVAACSPRARAPIDNTLPSPAILCGDAATELLRTTQLSAAQQASAHGGLAAACRDDAWPADYIRCMAGRATCVDSRTAEQKRHATTTMANAAMPRSCVIYVDSLRRLSGCARWPGRDNLPGIIDAVTTSWVFMVLSPEQRTAAFARETEDCNGSNVTIADAARTYGC